MSSNSAPLSEPPSSVGERIPTEELFDLPNIEEMGESLSEDEFTGPAMPTLLTLPTFSSYHLYRNNAQLAERRLRALQIGSAYLNKPFL